MSSDPPVLYRTWGQTAVRGEIPPSSRLTRDGRCISALCAPIGETHLVKDRTERQAYWEILERGAFAPAAVHPGATRLQLSHARDDDVVRLGVGVSFVETANALEAVFKVDPGRLGDALLEDVDSGLARALSFGAIALRGRRDWHDGRIRHRRTLVHLEHMAIVGKAAYPMARVTGRARDRTHERFKAMLAKYAVPAPPPNR